MRASKFVSKLKYWSYYFRARKVLFNFFLIYLVTTLWTAIKIADPLFRRALQLFLTSGLAFFLLILYLEPVPAHPNHGFRARPNLMEICFRILYQCNILFLYLSGTISFWLLGSFRDQCTFYDSQRISKWGNWFQALFHPSSTITIYIVRCNL